MSNKATPPGKDPSRTLEALQTSINMETEGNRFYIEASAKSKNEAAKKLLAKLGEEELVHLENFKKIYAAMTEGKGWPAIKIPPHGTSVTVFHAELAKLSLAGKAPRSEIDVLKKALDLENRTYDFYMARLKDASGETEASFYEAVARQERTHHILLSDFLEFLEDPSSYFTRTERHSLDG